MSHQSVFTSVEEDERNEDEGGGGKEEDVGLPKRFTFD